MPIYEYRCENGHTFEVMQRMSEDAIEECQVCGGKVERVFHAPAVHFKGSGFYNTDYGKQKKSGSSNGKSEGESSGESSSSESKDSKSETKKTETKSDSKSGSDSSS